MIVAAPKDEAEFQHLLYTAVGAGRTMAVRYPRGNGGGTELDHELKTIAIGTAEVLRRGDDIALLAIGATVHPSLAASAKLAEEGVNVTVVNARFAKPLDSGLIRELAEKTGRIVTVEENSAIGGFGSGVLELLSDTKLSAVVESIGLPDVFVEHGTQELLRLRYEMDSEGIAGRVRLAFPELFLRTPGGERR
jgi:1-deoxy-D-xylulose-5-phosphate synthase